MEALRAETSVAELCRKYAIQESTFYKWNKEFVEAGKKRLAVQSAWAEDLQTHVDFEGWQFISRNGLNFEDADLKQSFVCFGSFQDYLGRNSSTGGIKSKNEWVHTINWDCVIVDEYHYGAWRENAKELFEAEGKKELEFGEGEGIEYFDEGIMPITGYSGDLDQCIPCALEKRFE